MQRLRHPIDSIREPFGKAGLIVACLALVFAMVGGAYAAGKLTSTQKKEVVKIAKKEAKKYANSNPGPEGKQGPAGTNGTNGTNGKDGTSATTAAIPTSSATCNHNGGVEVKSASPPQNVCNGQTGWAEKLPSGKQLTGQWSDTGYTGGGLQTRLETGITYPFAVENEQGEGPLVHYIKAPSFSEFVAGEFPTPPSGCSGTYIHPAAEPGNLCVFGAFQEENVSATGPSGEPLPAICNYATGKSEYGRRCHLEEFEGEDPNTGEPKTFPALPSSPFGFVIYVANEQAGAIFAHGTWAVTAE